MEISQKGLDNPRGNIKRLVMQNITCWGPSAKNLLRNFLFDIFVFPETHSDLGESNDIIEFCSSLPTRLLPLQLSPEATS